MPTEEYFLIRKEVGVTLHTCSTFVAELHHLYPALPRGRLT